MPTLADAINDLAASENELTISVMHRIALTDGLTNPELVNDLYERVIFFTGDHDQDHGFGSSDFWAVYRSFEQAYLQGLQVGDKVIEIGECGTKGVKGTVYISENEGPTKGSLCVRWENGMGTSVTHGTRRLIDVASGCPVCNPGGVTQFDDEYLCRANDGPCT
jgi:hypothetical protein